MLSELPKQVGRFELARSDVEESKVTYHSQDRVAKVVCSKVTTSQGDVWNCELFDSAEEAYGRKNRNTSAIARSVAEFEEVLTGLDEACQ